MLTRRVRGGETSGVKPDCTFGGPVEIKNFQVAASAVAKRKKKGDNTLEDQGGFLTLAKVEAIKKKINKKTGKNTGTLEWEKKALLLQFIFKLGNPHP